MPLRGNSRRRVEGANVCVSREGAKKGMLSEKWPLLSDKSIIFAVDAFVC